MARSLWAVGLTCAVAASGCGADGRVAHPAPASFNHYRFDPTGFAATTGTVNPWLPLLPGTQWVRQGATDVGHRRVPHRVVSTVTDVHRVVDGVRTVLVLDRGIDSGQIAHESIDYFAQDRRGNVWNVGSYAEAYEAGRFVSVRDSWLAGVKGAKPGILMPDRPTTRTPPWLISQPPGADPDAAQVVQTGRRRCVAFKCYSHVLVVREGKASALDNEFKYYAPGVGQILNTPKSKSMHHDFEQLINLTRLTRRGLAEASAEALKLDRHARVTSAAVFGHSAPASRGG